KHLDCDFNPWRDTELLKTIPSLKEINERPAADFWKKADAERAEFDAWVASVAKLSPEKQAEAVVARVKKANPDFVGELTPSSDGAATVALTIRGDGVTDLAPVRALPALTSLSYASTGPKCLADVWCLKGLRLTHLSLTMCFVNDLSLLRDMPL